jgi:cytochrome c-type biogenesis protein CcmH
MSRVAMMFALAIALFAFPVAAQEGALKVPDAAQFVGAPQGTPLTGQQLATRANEVGGLLRCPVCQGMSVADSPAEMAVNMKAQVQELLARGYTEEQILKYFELSYGQFVLLKPKFEGVNTMVWLLPLIALLLGAVVLYFAFRRLSGSPAPGSVPPPTTNHQPTQNDDPYLARVRDMVGGKQ